MAEPVFTRAQYELFWSREIERLHRTGPDQMRGSCPVHGGDSPDTLLVHLDTGFAHCFKCHNDGEAWNMFDFAMARYGMDAGTARDYVRSIVGDLKKPSVAPWNYPFPKPLSITTDAWRLGTLARLIEHYREKFDGEISDQETGRSNPGWQPYALYCYPTVKRLKLRLRHRETGEKRLAWLALTEKGGWARPSKVGGDPTPPYRAETLKGAKEIWLLNGEKAVDRAVEAWPIIATCLPNGEAHWRDEYLAHFQGADAVYIVTDNDPTGVEHGQVIGSQLARAGIENRIVALPGLPPKADLWDWIEAGHDAVETLILALASPSGDPAYERPAKTKEKTRKKASENGQPPGPPPLPVNFDPGKNPDLVTGFGYSDMANAARLALVADGSLAYVHDLDEPFLVFNGQIWVPGGDRGLYPLCEQTLHLLQWQANQVGGETGQKIYKFAEKKLDSGPIHSMIRLVRRRIERRPDEFDCHPLLINCSNGTFDLETGKLRAAERADCLTHVFPFAYDPQAPLPLQTLRIMAEWFGGGPDAGIDGLDRADHMLAYLQRVCGYLLTGAVLEKAFFSVFGSGNNGKSTFFWLLEKILGKYAVTISASSLTRGWGRNENNVNADVARTRGARAAFAGEPPQGEKFDQAMIKKLTQGDVPITGVFKGHQPFSFMPTAKIILETNAMPQIDGDDPAFLLRAHLIKFDVTFAGGEKAGQALRTRMRPELNHFFNWCLQGAGFYLESGLERPQETVASLAEVRDEQAREDRLQPFLEEYFNFGSEHRCSIAEVETLYRKWCERFKERPLPRNHLSRRLCARRGIERGNDPTNHNQAAWLKGLAPKLAFTALANPGGRQPLYKDAQYKDDD